MKLKQNLTPFIWAVLLLLLVTGLVLAVDGLSIPWWTVDGGGGVSTGGAYTLHGTLGQAEADNVSQGGNYAVAGGFWGQGMTGTAPPQGVYLPVVVRP